MFSNDSGLVPQVTLENLDVSQNPGGDGVDVTAAHVTVLDSVVSNNSDDGIQLLANDFPTKAQVTVTGSSVDANGDGKNLGSGEGIGVDIGSVTVTNSSVSRNTGGGVVVDDGSATVVASTLDSNVGGGLVSDGNGTAASLVRSTVSNTVPFTGGRPPFGGGVLAFPGSTVTVSTSTLVGNTGQGVASGGATTTVSNSTITGTKPAASGNTSFAPGAVSNGISLIEVARSAVRTAFGPSHALRAAAVPTGTLTVSGTALAANTVPNCTGTIADKGYDLSDTAACSLTGTGSVTKAAAYLGPLADNGGPTRTQLPAKHSALLDRIPAGSAGCSDGSTDQRGDPRLVHQACDIGAVELAQPALLITPGTLPGGTVGTPYSVTLHASGGLGAPYSFALHAGTLPPGVHLSTGGVLSGTPTAAGTYRITVAVDDPTLRDYTIVVAASAAPASAGAAPIAATGSDTRTLLDAGVLAVAIGGLLLVAGAARARRGRHRRA